MIAIVNIFFVFVQLSISNDPLTELSNPGASGSLFFVTHDDEFIIKTVQHKEAEFLQKLLPGYYMVSSQWYEVATYKCMSCELWKIKTNMSALIMQYNYHSLWFVRQYYFFYNGMYSIQYWQQ